MPTSDEELAEQVSTVETLRAEVAQAEADRIAREASTSSDVTMLQLQAEEARLEAQLTYAKAREDAITAGDYVDTPMAAAQAELRMAVAQQEAAQAAAEGKVPEAPPEPPIAPVVTMPPPSSPVLPPMPGNDPTEGIDS